MPKAQLQEREDMGKLVIGDGGKDMDGNRLHQHGVGYRGPSARA